MVMAGDKDEGARVLAQGLEKALVDASNEPSSRRKGMETSSTRRGPSMRAIVLVIVLARIGDDGHSQMGLEDIALMRVLPTMGVFQPMDDAETQAIMDYLVRDYVGPAYLRLTRQNLPDYSSSAKPFVPGTPCGP